jgi:hypothetical protein
MAFGLSCWSTRAAAQSAQRRYRGRVLRWRDVVGAVAERWKLPARRRPHSTSLTAP